ncbi:MAG: hypothetical protein WDW38_004368 [Sanguina aurantia]
MLDAVTVTNTLERVSSLESRRSALSLGLVAAPLLLLSQPSNEAQAAISGYEPMEALKGKDYGKPRIFYPDYEQLPSGLQYKDMRAGSGDVTPVSGDSVVIDWDGYTIGYYGRPFEARNKPKGSSFSDENKEFYRFVVGGNTVIPAFQEAILGMKVGGIRRLIVPRELGYPKDDWRAAGPPPTTFSGQRALGFVLENQGMIDKTLMFDIELIRVQKVGEKDVVKGKK